MSQKSPIQWTEHTWNPLAGCTIKSPGCLRCYAAKMSGRLEAMGQAKYAGTTIKKGSQRIFNGLINYDEQALFEPLKRKKPTTYFVNSMSDLFWGDEEDLEAAQRLGVENPRAVPFEFIDKVFAVMALSPQHTFQVLTKRPQRMVSYFDEGSSDYPFLRAVTNEEATGIDAWFAVEMAKWAGRSEIDGPLPNVWLGVSVEDQKRADQRIPLLLQTPTAVRFLSVEPLLGPIEFSNVSRRPDAVQVLGRPALEGINWVIIGGESGSGARPMSIEWVRSILAQCKAVGVPAFVKQLGAKPFYQESGTAADLLFPDGVPEGATISGGWVTSGDLILKDRKGGDPSEWPEDLRVRQFPEVAK